MSVQSVVIRSLLAILNSRWLNSSPCRYGFIGNVDAFSIENLRSEEKQRPGITVQTLIEEADRFACCPIGSSVLTVLEGDGTSHEATSMDINELRMALRSKGDG